MQKPRFSERSLPIKVAFSAALSLLILAGCNATGLPIPEAPTATLVAPTPTDVAAVPPVTPTTLRLVPTPRSQPTRLPTPAATDVPTTAPTEAATEAPTQPATNNTSLPTAQATPAESRTARPGATGQPAGTTPTATLLPNAERAHIFEEVWSTVESHYLYADFHGADWKALHDKYLPLATRVATPEQFYKAISDMVDELKDDHSRYLSPQAAREEDDLQNGNANYVGVGILSSPDKDSLMVVFVFPGSPAEKAGLKRRDRITAVDGIPFTDPRNEPSRIRGPKDSTVMLTVHSPERAPRDVSIVRNTITGAIAPAGSRLAADPGTGFLIIPDLWTDDMAARVDAELTTMLDSSTPLKGLMLDLRGNGGGFRTVLEEILGDFVTGEVGTFFNQAGEHPFDISKGTLYERLKEIPVVVLVDKGTESYAEVLAAALQAKGRAKVVGTASAGNTETIYRYDFEDRSRLWVAEESFKLPDGTNLEGRGVIPDVTVDKDWTAYTEADDPQIAAALELLKKK